jgi:hypothetical protein
VVAFEVLAAVLVFGLGVFTALGLVAGMMGIVGAVKFTRCEQCGRLVLSSMPRPVGACAWCSHRWLIHPLIELHHLGQSVPRAQRKSQAA